MSKDYLCVNFECIHCELKKYKYVGFCKFNEDLVCRESPFKDYFENIKKELALLKELNEYWGTITNIIKIATRP